MKLGPYPEYQETGVQWLGSVPNHWRVLEPRRVFTLRREPEKPNDVHLTPSQHFGVLPQAQYMELTGSRVVLNLSGTLMQHVEPGDFISHLRTFQGGLELARMPGKVSPAYTVVSPLPDVEPHFFRYVFKSQGYIAQIASVTDQLRDGQTMRFAEFNKTPVPLPPLSEQRMIANFLDRETTEIDAFIADQERLIELLEERRAATIAHAVTKGLDTTAPMKDSGIDWLGYVPRHWQIARLKNSIQDAKNGVWGLEPDGSELDLRCVRVADFDRPRLSIHDRNATLRKIPLNEQKGRILNKGDLLLEKSGGGEKSPVGFVVRYDRDEPAVCSNFVARLALRPGMDSQFWTYLHSMLYSRRLTQRSIKQTTGIQNLDQASYFDELVAFPTHKEQCAIAEFLDREMAELDAAVSDAREAIALSRERRAALISAAVTGQVDVTQISTHESTGEVLEDEVRV